MVPGLYLDRPTLFHRLIYLTFLVPGIPDNPGKHVRRGRLSVPGTDVKKVFEPVVREVIALIEGQIEATQKPIKAVLLVGGFGQSAYLRDRIRQEIGSKIEVMQSPNG